MSISVARYLRFGLMVGGLLATALPAHAGPARNKQRAARGEQRARDFAHAKMLEKLAAHGAYHFKHEAPNAEHAVVNEEAHGVFAQQAARPEHNNAYRTAWALVEQMGPTEAMSLSRGLVGQAKAQLQMNKLAIEHGAPFPPLVANPNHSYQRMLHAAIVNERLVDAISHAKKLNAEDRKRMAQHIAIETH